MRLIPHLEVRVRVVRTISPPVVGCDPLVRRTHIAPRVAELHHPDRPGRVQVRAGCDVHALQDGGRVLRSLSLRGWGSLWHLVLLWSEVFREGPQADERLLEALPVVLEPLVPLAIGPIVLLDGSV